MSSGETDRERRSYRYVQCYPGEKWIAMGKFLQTLEKKRVREKLDSVLTEDGYVAERDPVVRMEIDELGRRVMLRGSVVAVPA